MRPLTPTEASELRHERDAILAKLAESTPLRRRLRVVEGQLLSGLFAPGPGVLPEQLSLTPEDKADLASAAEEGAKVAAAEAKSKTTRRGGKAAAAAAAAPAPLVPPSPPTDCHPQRALRGWLWARLEQTSGLTLEQLSAELWAFTSEDVLDTLNLLFACDLVGYRDTRDGTVWWASENGVNGAVDRLVLDAGRAAVDGNAPVREADVAAVLGVTEGLASYLLDELHEAGRIEPAERDGGVVVSWRLPAKKHAKKSKSVEGVAS